MASGSPHRPRLLYFAPASHGGIADYALHQAAALADAGVEVDFLCAPSLAARASSALRLRPELADDAPEKGKRPRLVRAWQFLSLTVGRHRHLARVVARERHSRVLFASYAEYFAPLWAGPLRRLARAGVVFASVVHDPIRDAVLGPRWWHARSVAAGYSFLHHAFLHEEIALDTGDPRPGLTRTVIPHGPYPIATQVPSRAAARAHLGLPADKPVVLAFGLIRDNKNLHLTIEALRHHPDLQLIVAGNELSSAGKPATHYRALAESLGVGARCHWHIRYIPGPETGAYFAAADFLALTYSGAFRSASGVLNAAVQFRLPCLASSGAGPLRTAVEKYGLGLWVPPDDAAAVREGYRRLLDGEARPRWDDYARENSWARNAALVVATMFPNSP